MATQTVKMVVTGPFNSGKTQFVGSISEIDVVSTERKISSEAEKVKDQTTVAMDFGRISLNGGIVLYLFGTPGQERFRSLWEDIAYGALGALVLVDSRRIDASFDVLGLVEESGLPYAVAFNAFPDAPSHYTEDQLRAALDLEPDTPMVTCDARDTNSSVDALLALVQHLIDRHPPETR